MNKTEAIMPASSPSPEAPMWAFEITRRISSRLAEIAKRARHVDSELAALTELAASAVAQAMAPQAPAAWNAALEHAIRACKAQGGEWASDAVVPDKNYADHCAELLRAMKLTGPDNAIPDQPPAAWMGLDGKVYPATVERICDTDEALYSHLSLQAAYDALAAVKAQRDHWIAQAQQREQELEQFKANPPSSADALDQLMTHADRYAADSRVVESWTLESLPADFGSENPKVSPNQRRQELEAALRNALIRANAAQKIPPGFSIKPRHATPAMIKAATALIKDGHEPFNWQAWEAMFDAAPSLTIAPDPWHEAVLAECMKVEGCYNPRDPSMTLRDLLNWHIHTELEMLSEDETRVSRLVFKGAAVSDWYDQATNSGNASVKPANPPKEGPSVDA